MYFVGLGLALMILKYLELGPVAGLSWMWVLSPFPLAMAWWAWADASGYTRKRAMQRELERKNVRIDRNRANTGRGGKGGKR
jgi:small Trp-rich protein